MLFKSFDTLLQELPRLADRVPDADSFWGHTPGPAAPAGKLPELLQEHIDRVNTTSLQLITAHGLEPVIDDLITALLTSIGEPATAWDGNFVKTGFLAAIAFHDFGKLNENYQRHLNNPHFAVNVSNNIGSEHSGLGAFLWLHYAIAQLDSVGPDDVSMDKLTALALDFADLILNHHATKLTQREYTIDKYARLETYRAKLQIPAVPDLGAILADKQGYYQDFYLGTGQQKPEGFPRFALLKLCFSLLTASDYLATLGYMQTGGDYTRLDAQTLGILSTAQKEQFYARFNSFPYNQEALTSTDKVADWPWDTLQERTGENLNLLRKKLLAEVVRNVRQQPRAPVYYLEAPTGAGKTNLSLAVTLELLRHDSRLGKVFYVFPFTTLITQTYTDIKTKLGLSDADLVQLHSKAEYAERSTAGEDGSYGAHWHNHVDNLFVQYPIVLLSHVRFFDVLKSNRKDANYLLHRLANSVVILDEIQSYSPLLWDHVNYFLIHYARHFNIRIVVMSATLPKLHQLTREAQLPPVASLVTEPGRYFRNPNFAGRVRFDFGLLEDGIAKTWRERYKSTAEDDRQMVLAELADAVGERCEAFAATNDSKAVVIIEFITKKSAAGFAVEAVNHPLLGQYELLILSGTILEPRRREVVDALKSEKYRAANPRILLICTQVVEAGVDIDMDLGFKDRSLLDSDEQLAGRVNRNALRDSAPVYLFDLDAESAIYGPDLRLRVAREKLSTEECQRILREKDFDTLYREIIRQLNFRENKITDTFGAYQELLQLLDYPAIDRKFQLIENDSESVFIPLMLRKSCFSDKEQQLLRDYNVCQEKDELVAGKSVFELYLDTVHNKTGDFIRDREARQRLQSIMSKFTISVYPKLAAQIRASQRDFAELHDQTKNYEMLYLSNPEQYYSYKEGLLSAANFAIGDFF